MIFSTFLLIALILPVAIALPLSWYWWKSLARPWTFVLVSVIGLYIVLVTMSMPLLTRIGVSGQPSSNPPKAFGPVEQNFSLTLLAFTAFALVALWMLKSFLAKAKVVSGVAQ